jgi:hypothetical protein
MRLYVSTRNVFNRISYGRYAPRHSQRIYVNVSAKTPYLPPESQPYAVKPHKLSGMVIGGEWDLQAKPITDCLKVKFCLLHWIDGLAWKDTGCFEYLLDIIRQRGRVDGLRSLNDIESRYARLDQIYEEVQKDGRLLNAHELGNAKGRNLENSGILIHLGRNGEPIFGGAGCHRIAMAISLNIDIIPAKVGMIHAKYIHQWLLEMSMKAQ